MNGRLTDLATEIGLEIAFFQSNHEGAIIDYLHTESSNADGIIINPGALTHYSYALRDAIVAIGTETIEIHLSNLFARDDFRQKSVIAPVCRGQICGFGFYGYAMALSYFSDMLED
jgi:3-dehydroquinate dehydratase-2